MRIVLVVGVFQMQSTGIYRFYTFYGKLLSECFIEQCTRYQLQG